MNSCLFCEIVSGSRPGATVFRDEVCLALMDLFPVSAGHVLVIPVRHAVLLEELTGAERSHILEAAVRIMKAQKAAGLGSGVNLLVNDGKAANQHIPHVHVHLVPRRTGDTLSTLLQFVSRGFGVFGAASHVAQLEATALRIRENIP